MWKLWTNMFWFIVASKLDVYQCPPGAPVEESKNFYWTGFCLYYLIARLASRSEMHYKQYVWQSKLIAFGWRYKLGQLVANIIILRCTMRAGQVEWIDFMFYAWTCVCILFAHLRHQKQHFQLPVYVFLSSVNPISRVTAIRSINNDEKEHLLLPKISIIEFDVP